MQCIHSQDTLPTNPLGIIPGDTSLGVGLGRDSCVLNTERLRCDVTALKLSQNCTEFEVTQKGLSAEIANTVRNLSTAQDLRVATFTETVPSYLCWSVAGKCGNMSLSHLCCFTEFLFLFSNSYSYLCHFHLLLLKP